MTNSVQSSSELNNTWEQETEDTEVKCFLKTQPRAEYSGAHACKPSTFISKMKISTNLKKKKKS